MKTGTKILLVTIGILLSSFFARAVVRLPDIIGSSMVLQQKQTVPIWGFADAGETVTVTFGKQRKTIVADANGKWRVNLDKMPASFTRRYLPGAT